MVHRRRIGALCTALACIAPLPVQAAEDPTVPRFYVSVGLGWSYAEPLVIEGAAAVIDYDFNPSVASLAAGLSGIGRWRFELEAVRTDNAPEVLYVRGTDVELDSRGDDELSITSILLGAYHDFLIGTAVRPYLGVGIGAAEVDLRFIEYEVADGSETPLIDDSTWTFAYQAVAGLTVPVSRHLGLGVEYRYWRAPDLELEAVEAGPIKSSQAMHSGWLRLSYQPGGYAWPSAPDLTDVAGSGFYLSGMLGGGWAPDRDFKYTQGQFDAFDIGPMIGGAAGYQLSGRWRFELDAARRRNEMEIYDTRVEETRTRGRVVSDSLSLNAGYRFRPGRAIDPYVSLGFGAARIRYEIDVAADRSALIDDTVNPWIVQWALGIDLALSRRWTVSTDYRGLFSDHFTLERTDGETVTTTYLTHAMTLSARYRL
ncbi:MAG: outer membrane protein [Pseudomonadales bacterium]